MAKQKKITEAPKPAAEPAPAPKPEPAKAQPTKAKAPTGPKAHPTSGVHTMDGKTEVRVDADTLRLIGLGDKLGVDDKTPGDTLVECTVADLRAVGYADTPKAS